MSFREAKRIVARTAAAGAGTGGLAFLASLTEYGSGTGSETTRIVLEHYVPLLVLANLRLFACLVAAGAFWGAVGGVVLAAAASIANRRPGWLPSACVGAGLFGAVTLLRLTGWLLDSPGSVVMLWPYDTHRLDVLYDHVPPLALDLIAWGSAGLAGLVVAVALGRALLVEMPELVARVQRLRRPRVVPIAGTSVALAIVVPAVVVANRSEPRAVPSRDPRPNVLVLMSDSLRADRVEAWRDGEPVMPSVARLADRGASFRACFTPIARTTESFVTLMTGTWPQTHGVRTSWIAPKAFHPSVALPRAFRDAGYATAVLGDWSATDGPKFDLGFDEVVVPPETWSLKTFVARGGRLSSLLALVHVPQRLLEIVAPEVAYSPGVDANAIVRPKVVGEIERLARGDRPFFMTVFTGNTHAPFTPAGRHHRRFSDPLYHGPNRYGLCARTVDDALAVQSEQMKARDLGQLEAVYDASARTFDDEVGVYLAALESTGRAKETIVVVLSDHGTAFYERGSFGQGNEIVSDVSNRIPFVLHDPRRAVAKHRIDHVVRAVDVGPTLLDLAGVPVPAAMEGRSLRPYLEVPDEDLGLPVYGETGLWIGKQPWQEEDLDFGFPQVEKMCGCPDFEAGWIAIDEKWLRLMVRAQHRMLRTDRWKLVYVPTRTGFRTRLYDVTLGDRSPDLASEHPEVVTELLAIMSRWLGREDATIFAETLPPPHAKRGS